MNPLVRALAEDAITFHPVERTPPEHLQAALERIEMAGQDRVMERLVRLLREAIAVLAQCEAVYARRGPCGVWFVRYRDDNRFCSGKCQSRFTTRAARNRLR